MKDGLQPLDAEKGELLLKLARSTLMEKFGRRLPAAEDARLQSALKGPLSQALRGTFVTLMLKGRLRGCIGNLFSTDPLTESIRRNAAHAAFNDPSSRWRRIRSSALMNSLNRFVGIADSAYSPARSRN